MKYKLLRNILGEKKYQSIRARKLFRSLDSPYPLFPETPISVDWNKFDNPKSISVEADKEIQLEKPVIPMVYLVSPTQRSGTNFLSFILNNHPDLSFPGGAKLPDEQCLFTYSGSLMDYVSKTVSTWAKWLDGEEEKHAKAMMKHIGDGILSYLRSFIDQDNMLLLKTPDAGKLSSFFHLFPQAKLIVLVRDGRDTIDSFEKSWGTSSTFKQMCIRWADRVNTIQDLRSKAEQQGYGAQVFVARFDQLTDNAESEVRNILDFLGLDKAKYPWEKLDSTPVLGSSSTKTDGHVHWTPVQKDENFKPNEKWLSWSERKKDVFKRYAGKGLIDLGFATDNNW